MKAGVRVTGVLGFPHSHCSLPELLLPESMNRNQLMFSFVPGLARLNDQWNLWVHFFFQACGVNPLKAFFQAARNMRMGSHCIYYYCCCCCYCYYYFA